MKFKRSITELITNLFSRLVAAKVPSKFVRVRSFQYLLLLVSAVNPSLRLTVFLANKKQCTILENEFLGFLTKISFLIFRKIDRMLAMVEKVKKKTWL